MSPARRQRFRVFAHKDRGSFSQTARHRLKIRRTASFRPRAGKSFFKRIFIALFLLIFIFAVWKLFNSWKNSQWVLGTRITVVVASKSPAVYSYSPQTERLTVFELPEKTQLETVRGYGRWFVGSLWQLGKQEKLEGELLQQTIQKALGLPVDAWIEEKGGGLFALRKLGFASAFVEALTSTSIKSNLTFFDRLHLIMRVGTVGIGNRRQIDLAAFGVIEEEELEDGTTGFVVIPEKAKLAFEIWRDDLVFAEEKKVVIVNTTERSGLAQDVTRIASVLGVRIIGAQTNKEKVNDCEVRGLNSQLKSLSAKRLVAVFGCEEIDTKVLAPQDLELWLGEGFSKRF